MTAMRGDAEISALLKDVTLPYSGVLPNIHPSLLPKDSKNKKRLVEEARDKRASESEEIMDRNEETDCVSVGEDDETEDDNEVEEESFEQSADL